MANANTKPMTLVNDILVPLADMCKQSGKTSKSRYVFIGEVMGRNVCIAANKKDLSKAVWEFLQIVQGGKEKTEKVKRFINEIETSVNVDWAYAVYVKLREDGCYTIKPKTKEQFDKIWEVVEYVAEKL